MPVKGLSAAEIAEITRAQVAAGAKSTDRAQRLPGETATEANARITSAYKEMTAKPIISQEAKDAGVQVKFVRSEAGGVGEYRVITPIGYSGPSVRTTEFTPGVIPANVKKVTGTSVGFNPDDYKDTDDATRIQAKIARGETLTPDEKAFMDKIAAGYKPVAPTLSVNPATVKATTPTTKKYTSAELQRILSKFTSGGTLTVEEKAAIGIGPAVTSTTTPTTTAPTTTAPTTTKPTTSTTTTTTTNPTTTTTTTVTTDPTTTVTEVVPTIPVAPIGTPPAFVYDPVTKTWVRPDKPEEEGTWAWDNNKGWVDTTVNPGSTGFETGATKTLALDTFKNTLALFFGPSEVSQPWANALFQVVSGFYKSGSTIDESLNLALRDARNNPALKPFTDRFAGVYALQDRRAKGEAIDVPTIADFFKSQEELGARLRDVGLGDLATNEILGEVLGTGKSVAAVLNLVNDVFMTIDNAPEQLKKDLQAVAPGIDRTSIAKALLLGKRGAEDLQKQIKEVSVLSAAKSQGVGISNTLAADIAARGVDYGTALTNFGTVAKGAPDLQKLTEISTGQAVKPVSAQETIIKSLFQQDVKEQEKIRLEAEKEAARFGGASGTMGSRSLASRNRANRVI